jgi:hypothetical protein
MGLIPKPPRGTLYIVGRVTRWPAWEFKGVFTRKARAIEVCHDETYFVGPASLNKQQPTTLADWPGMFYPREIEGAR